MNKKLFLGLIFVLSLIGAQVEAGFGFGFGFGGGFPCYAPEPSFSLGFGGPIGDGIGVGFGVNIPLRRRRCCRIVRPVHHVIIEDDVYVEDDIYLDNQNKTYWAISNDTERPIIVENCDGKSKVIQPGQTRKLSHANGYNLRVSYQNNENIYADVSRENHYISIQASNGGILVN